MLAVARSTGLRFPAIGWELALSIPVLADDQGWLYWL
jgi:hypothetical protein